MATPSIAMIPSGYKDGKVYSVLPNNSDGDFNFTRGSAATRVNAQGLVENVQILSSELVSNGNFSQGSQDWTKDSGWSIQNGQAICNGVGVNSIQQSGVTTTGKTYKLTFDIISKSNDDFLIISTNFGDTYINGSSTSLGTNTFYITPTSGTGIRFRVGNGTTLSIDDISIKEITDDTNLPRLDYSDGSCPSLLLEPQSTNLYLNSETLSTQSNATSASTYTVSFYGTGTITFSGTHTGTLVGTAADERVSATFTTTSGTLLSTVSGTCTKGQLEALSSATSYIPTNGSIATRLADQATGSGNASLINSTEGVLYAAVSNVSKEYYSEIALTDGTNSQRVQIYFNKDALSLMFFVRVDGVILATHTVSSSGINYEDTNKIAIKYKTNDISFWLNGTKVGTDTTGTFIPNKFTQLGFNSGGGGAFYGKAKAVAVYKEALTDAELQELTTI